MVYVTFSAKDAFGDDQFVSTVSLVEKMKERLITLCPGSVFGNRKCCLSIGDGIFKVMTGTSTLGDALHVHRQCGFGEGDTMAICFVSNQNCGFGDGCGSNVWLPFVFGSSDEYLLLVDGDCSYLGLLKLCERISSDLMACELGTATCSEDLSRLSARDISRKMTQCDYLVCCMKADNTDANGIIVVDELGIYVAATKENCRKRSFVDNECSVAKKMAIDADVPQDVVAVNPSVTFHYEGRTRDVVVTERIRHFKTLHDISLSLCGDATKDELLYYEEYQKDAFKVYKADSIVGSLFGNVECARKLHITSHAKMREDGIGNRGRTPILFAVNDENFVIWNVNPETLVKDVLEQWNLQKGQNQKTTFELVDRNGCSTPMDIPGYEELGTNARTLVDLMKPGMFVRVNVSNGE